MVGNGSNRILQCTPLPSLVLSTVSIQPYSFVITTNVDLTITFVDDRADEILRDNYNSSGRGLKGMSLYSLIHVADTDIIRKMHYEVFKLGAYRTPFYRLIMQQGYHTFYVESNIFRYTLNTNKVVVDSITIVSHLV
uniref:PAS domain-containing protein n=1 Tax=Heterorhabditis bacteriophora TaxID=37862 RepID=A0A1I7WLN6_HETBA